MRKDLTNLENGNKFIIFCDKSMRIIKKSLKFSRLVLLIFYCVANQHSESLCILNFKFLKIADAVRDKGKAE